MSDRENPAELRARRIATAVLALRVTLRVAVLITGLALVWKGGETIWPGLGYLLVGAVVVADILRSKATPTDEDQPS